MRVKKSPLSISKVPALKSNRGKTISLSRNILAQAMSLSGFQINVVIAVANAIMKNIQVGDRFYPVECDREFIVLIPNDIMTRKHDANYIKTELEKLMSVTVEYAREVPGCKKEISATIISGFERENGQFRVHVPALALPWYLFCGLKVGFGAIERDVILRLRSVYEKRLYLYLSGIVDRKSNSANTTIDVAKLITILAYPEDNKMVYGLLRRDLLVPFKEHLEKLGSYFAFEYHENLSQSGKRGRPYVESVSIRLKKTTGASEDSRDVETAIDMLRRIYEILGPNKPQTSFSKAITTLEENDRVEEFLAKARRVAEKDCPADATSGQKKKFAAIIKKILVEDYEIR